jgi:peptidoglycan hydrolase CwlO-like protein
MRTVTTVSIDGDIKALAASKGIKLGPTLESALEAELDLMERSVDEVETIEFLKAKVVKFRKELEESSEKNTKLQSEIKKKDIEISKLKEKRRQKIVHFEGSVE